MPRRLWIAALVVWPGLPQIWSGQDVLGMIPALSFAVSLNLAIVSRFLWTEAFGPGWAGFLAGLSACHWAASFGYGLWRVWGGHPDRHRAEIVRRDREATGSDLQGRWDEAWRRFERILTREETDADALKQLGILYVRTDQAALARRAFRRCLEGEGGVTWRREIQRTLKRLGEGSST